MCYSCDVSDVCRLLVGGFMFPVFEPKKLIKRNQHGQNVLEYLLMFAVVLAIYIVFYNPFGGPARTALENIANDVVLDIARLNNEIDFP